MAVYVDQLVRYPKNQVKVYARKYGLTWCHMTADTIKELHDAARAIGLLDSWFQNTSIPHYDLTPTKRYQAIQNGAVQTTTTKLIEIWRNPDGTRREDNSEGAGSIPSTSEGPGPNSSPNP